MVLSAHGAGFGPQIDYLIIADAIGMCRRARRDRQQQRRAEDRGAPTIQNDFPKPPASHIHLSYAGLTRVSIIQERWITGSSPMMTI
jgi:hypothetical protein